MNDFNFALRFGWVDLTLEVPLRLSAFHFVSGYGRSLFFVRNPILTGTPPVTGKGKIGAETQ